METADSVIVDPLEPNEICMSPASEELRPAGAAAWTTHDAQAKVNKGAQLEAALKETQRKLRAKELELQHARDYSHELSRRLLTAQEEERTRIAAELHDDVSQQVAAIAIALSTIRRRLPAGDAGREVDNLKKEVGQLADTIRLLSHDLHPAVLRHVGLTRALRSRCNELARRASVKIVVDAADDLGRLPESTGICLFRVAQEALHNAIKHAGASRVTIGIVRKNNQIMLTVMDDGRGFSMPGHKRGLGFITMEERARIAGGRFAVTSAIGQGTEILIHVPVGV